MMLPLFAVLYGFVETIENVERNDFVLINVSSITRNYCGQNQNFDRDEV